MFDVDELYRVINIQWDGDDIITIKVAVENPCGDGIAIQTNQEIEKRGTVADHDGLFMVFLRQDFL